MSKIFSWTINKTLYSEKALIKTIMVWVINCIKTTGSKFVLSLHNDQQEISEYYQ